MVVRRDLPWLSPSGEEMMPDVTADIIATQQAGDRYRAANGGEYLKAIFHPEEAPTVRAVADIQQREIDLMLTRQQQLTQQQATVAPIAAVKEETTTLDTYTEKYAAYIQMLFLIIIIIMMMSQGRSTSYGY